jgi:hypothetical protein
MQRILEIMAQFITAEWVQLLKNQLREAVQSWPPVRMRNINL